MDLSKALDQGTPRHSSNEYVQDIHPSNLSIANLWDLVHTIIKGSIRVYM